MFCPNCGNNNADGVAFCANCGCQLDSQPQQQAAPQQPEYQQPQGGFQQPPYQQPYQQPYMPTAPATVPGKALGVTGMILGIVALALLCILGPVSLFIGIVGIILSAIGYSAAKKAGMKNGMAVAGIVCNSIAVAIYLVCLIIVLAFGTSLLYF